MNDAPNEDIAPRSDAAGTAPARRPRLRRLLVGGAAATALALGGLTVAYGGGDRGARMVERAGDRLELDDAQRASLDALVSVLTETGETLRGDVGRAELEALVAGPTFDQATALAMIESRADALRAAAPEIVSAAAGFYDGLDGSQRAEIDELLERAGRRGFGHRFGRD